MKRACALLLTLLLLGPTATADVLIEPSDDFYRTHAEECEYLDRSYTANGKEGYVALYQSPKSSRQRETVGNGAVLRGRWIYRGTWLAVEEEDSEELRGWVELSECVPVADYLSFESSTVLHKVFGNSLTSFVAALARGGSLDRDELDELQRYLDELKEGKS